MIMQAIQGVTPHFQYLFNRHKIPIGAEILMRYELDNIVNLIEKLEKENRILNLDLLAFQAAIAWQNKHKQTAASNFSGISLEDPKIIDYLLINDVMAQTTIELSERNKLSKLAIANLQQLYYYGFRISLDDYGTGCNGLNRLVELDIVEEIKIDKFFVQNLTHKTARTVIASTLALCSQLDCEVVVEGVESDWQLDILVDMGATRFQGFLFHEPEVLLIR